MTEVSPAPWSSTSLALHRSYSQLSALAGSPSLRSAQKSSIEAKRNNGTPGLPLDAKSDEEEETWEELPPGAYGGDGHNKQIVDLEPPARQCTNDARAVSQVSNTDRRNYSGPPSLVRTEHAEYAQDDNIVRVQPSLYVDYLSHDWKEEDIWSSWKYIVSERKLYGNRARLQNASWRAWTKSKYQLTTVSAETLNW